MEVTYRWAPQPDRELSPQVGQQTQMNLNPTPGVACGISLNYAFIAEVRR